MKAKMKAEDQTDYLEMYVYNSQLWEDLFEMVAEYLGESEHAGEEVSMVELSSDTVEDMTAWTEKRKALLRADFLTYWVAAEDVPKPTTSHSGGEDDFGDEPEGIHDHPHEATDCERGLGGDN